MHEGRSAETQARFHDRYPWRRTRLAAQSSRWTVLETSMAALQSWGLGIKEILPNGLPKAKITIAKSASIANQYATTVFMSCSYMLGSDEMQ